ncbi:MAG: single-stranded DNA-binding protein [Patescibacteria group bacterium]|nr:single-stranded DNA-binding protein [Patescibacteria group bacterium]
MASRSWNRVELIGNLTRDPELRYTPNGAAVVTFGIATNRTYVTEGERKEEVDFHKLVAWNKLAELCNQLLKKGMRVFVSGRLQTRSWEGQDGQQRQTTEIVIEDMIILSPKNNGTGTTPEDVDVGHAPIEKEEPKEKESKAPEEKEKPAPDEKAPQEEVKDDLPF